MRLRINTILVELDQWPRPRPVMNPRGDEKSWSNLVKLTRSGIERCLQLLGGLITSFIPHMFTVPLPGEGRDGC